MIHDYDKKVIALMEGLEIRNIEHLMKNAEVDGFRTLGKMITQKVKEEIAASDKKMEVLKETVKHLKEALEYIQDLRNRIDALEAELSGVRKTSGIEEIANES